MPASIVAAVAAVGSAYVASRNGDRSERAARDGAEAQLQANADSIAAAQALFEQEIAIAAQNSARASSFLQQGASEASSIIQPLAEQSAPLISKFLGQIDSGEFDQGEFDFQFDENENGFKFLLDQSLDAVDSRANASGLLNSGGRIKALQREAAGFTNSFVNDAFNRQSSEFNINENRNINRFARAQAGANIGLDSINRLADIRSNLGTGLANVQIGQGAQNLQSAGTLGLAQQQSALNNGNIQSGLLTNLAQIQNNTNSQISSNLGSALGAFSNVRFSGGNNINSSPQLGGTIDANGNQTTF